MPLGQSTELQEMGCLHTIKNESYLAYDQQQPPVLEENTGSGGQNSSAWGDGVLSDNPFGQEVVFKIYTDEIHGALPDVSYKIDKQNFDSSMTNGGGLSNATFLELGIQLLPDLRD